MNKLELENIIGNKLGVSGKEQKIATDVFIQSVSEYIECGDTIRIPDIGIFQLRKTEKSLKKS
jgi:nucleoid DNA-binding protein